MYFCFPPNSALRPVTKGIRKSVCIRLFLTVLIARENIEKILPWLEKNATKALVLVEESTCLITDYMREEEAKKAQEANK